VESREEVLGQIMGHTMVVAGFQERVAVVEYAGIL